MSDQLTSLAWVVNAYMLTFGGFLLLAGRFGDLFGHRRLFLGGTAAFTLASLVCGLSSSQEMLIDAARGLRDRQRQHRGLDVGTDARPAPVAALALLWLARAPVHGSFVVDVLPAMVLIGIGGGLAFNPVLMAAMSDVEPRDSGLASGIANTAFMMGGAVGLAVLASVASARTQQLLASGHGQLASLTGGYHVAFVIGALFSLAGAAIGAAFLRTRTAAARDALQPELVLEAA
jgi:MFS family permease